MLDFGDVVSGFITAPIVDKFGITYGDWSGLPDLLYVRLSRKQ